MAEKSQDEMLREAARARGFRLVKSRRRKAGGDYGKFGLTDLRTGRECFGFGPDGLTASADEVTTYLRGGEVASWKRSVIGSVGGDEAGKQAKPKAKQRGETSSSRAKPRKVDRPEQATAPAPAKAAKEGRPAPRPGEPPPAVEKPPPRIRPATRRDAAAIARLIGLAPALVAERLRGLVGGGDPPMLAEKEGIVGVVAWTIVPTLQRGSIGRITLLHVAEQARRQGIGTRLLEEAEAQLADAGVERIELLLEIDFDAPGGFLRRTGWERAANGFGKRPGGDTGGD